MSLARIVMLSAEISMSIMVFALGLKATVEDFALLFRRPGLLARSLISMSVIMPALAVLIDLTMPIDDAIKIALIALAASPVPPFLPVRQIRSGGSAEYAIGLLATAAVCSVLITPVVVEAVTGLVARDIHISPFDIAKVIAQTVLAPLGLGVLVALISPRIAKILEGPLSLLATILLIAAFVPIAVVAWSAFVTLLGNGVIFALVLFGTVGLFAGHVLGGPAASERTVLALATGARHPGVAIAVASLNFPGDKGVVSVIIYHLIVSAIVSLPYIAWRRRAQGAAK
jgi:bile acid:Na+ symporter, BASS family